MTTSSGGKMRGVGRPSGGVGAVGTGGLVRPLPARASRLLAVIATRLDSDGTVCGTVAELGDDAGLSRATAERAMADLEAVGLVRTSGQTTGAYRYLDERALKLLQRAPSRRTEQAGWREQRARAGGAQRAMNAALRGEAAAKEQLAQALEELSERRSQETATQGWEWLRAESLHAVRCFDADCERCMELERVLEEGTTTDVVDAARETLADAAELREAAVELVAAAKDRSVGARDRYHTAFQQLARCVQ